MCNVRRQFWQWNFSRVANIKMSLHYKNTDSQVLHQCFRIKGKWCNCFERLSFKRVTRYYQKHTCHISHCEIKSHRIWPIWKPIPIRLSNLTEFSDHLTTHLWRNKQKSHFVVFITCFLHINKSFWLLWGSSKVIFVKIPQNFIKSHLKFALSHRFQSITYAMYAKT